MAPLLKKGRGYTGLILSSHDRKGANCKRMNGTGKGNSCREEVGLLFLLIFAEKKFEEPLRLEARKYMD